MPNNLISRKSAMQCHWHWSKHPDEMDLSRLTPPNETILALNFLEQEVGIDKSSVLSADASSSSTLIRLEPKAPSDNTLININLDDPPPLELERVNEGEPSKVGGKIMYTSNLTRMIESESMNVPILSRKAEDADLFDSFSMKHFTRHTLTW